VQAYVALLRGVNVGGKNRLPMKELAGLCEQAGLLRVRTYIQSGNVIFEATEAMARKASAALCAAIEARFGFRSPVIVRSADELAEVIGGNPFLQAGAAEGELHVAFLQDAPDAAQVASLDPNRSPGDEFRVIGREVYLRCPKGVGQTKLTNAWLDSRLKTISTGRNWRTVRTLLEIAQAL